MIKSAKQTMKSIILHYSKKRQLGFTIIELLVVISVVALLASAIVYFLGEARMKARNSKRVADTAQIAKGLAIFYNQCNTYPSVPAPATGILLNNTKSLYSGTLGDCNSSDTVNGSNGVLPNGGFGAAHAAGTGETLFIPTLSDAPLPIDDGNLTAGNRCSENNTQTGYKWGQYSYASLAPSNPSQFWIYFCIGSDTGGLTAGRYIYTERGVFKYSGNMFP